MIWEINSSYTIRSLYQNINSLEAHVRVVYMYGLILMTMYSHGLSLFPFLPPSPLSHTLTLSFSLFPSFLSLFSLVYCVCGGTSCTKKIGYLEALVAVGYLRHRRVTQKHGSESIIAGTQSI